MLISKQETLISLTRGLVKNLDKDQFMKVYYDIKDITDHKTSNLTHDDCPGCQIAEFVHKLDPIYINLLDNLLDNSDGYMPIRLVNLMAHILLTGIVIGDRRYAVRQEVTQ